MAERLALGPPALRSHGVRLGGVASVLAGLGFILLFSISSMLLHRLGLNYEYTGGNPLEKVHPGTWLLALSLALFTFRDGAERGADRLLRDNPGLAFYLFAGALLTAYAMLAQRVPFTPLIDTFFLPVIVFVLLGALDGAARRWISAFIHVAFLANALIALWEFATGDRLTPFVAGTIAVTGDWRSTALFGHPLGNACLTGVYVLALAAGGDRAIPLPLRLAMIGLQLVAMVAFGGRAALVGLVILLVLMAARGSLGILAGRKVRLSQAVGVALLVPLVALVVVLAIEGGFFDRLLSRFAQDDGSAQTRIAMFRLFEPLEWRDILFGPNLDYVATLQRIEGIELGIESFWVAFILTYGALVSIPFFLGLACFCWEVIRATGSGSVVALGFFFAVASTSVSLSAKSPLFGMTIAVLMLLLARPERPPAKSGAHR